MNVKLVFSQFLIACVAIFASAQAWAVLHLEVTGGIDYVRELLAYGIFRTEFRHSNQYS